MTTDSKAIVIAHHDEPAPFHIPDAKALAMVQACARQLQDAFTVPDVLKVITKSEAMDAVLKKLKASENAQEAALRLRVEAEAHLGRISEALPKGARGHVAVANRDQPTKTKLLREHGVAPSRANVAERLAATPPAKVEAAINDPKNKSLHAVLTSLDLRHSRTWDSTPEKQLRDVAFLADEAICLLERSVKTKQPPHGGTVAEMRTRFTKLRGQKENV